MVSSRVCGTYAIWMDVHGEGLPAGSTIRPDRIIRSLMELLPQPDELPQRLRPNTEAPARFSTRRDL
jgi:hypothetical protein